MSTASNFKLSKSNQLDNSLRPSFHAKFLHDIRDVISNCLFADEELSGNLFCRFVLYQELEYFSFPISQ